MSRTMRQTTKQTTKRQSAPVSIGAVKRRRKAFWGVKTLVQLALLALVIATALVIVSGTLDNIAVMEQEIAATQAQIDAAVARRREIEDAAVYTRSFSFVEYIARTRLNLVRRDEIIFIMESSE